MLLMLTMLMGLFCHVAQAQVKPKAGVRKPVTKSTSAKPVPAVNAPVKEAPIEEKIEPIKGDPTKDNVAIYPFTSAGGYDYEYAQSVGNAVESGFVRSNRFNVVERNRFGAISQEERFKEVNTSSVVKIAAKFGAKYIITGHITGVNTGEVYTSDNKFSGYQTSISLSFKIIEVETSLIKASESLNIVGKGGSSPLSKGNAYSSIDGITRRIIASYFPQRFKFMSLGLTEVKKKQTVLKTFKVWGGSDNGLKVRDAIEVYLLNHVVNPNTGQKVEEKTIIGYATVIEVNSGSSATCEVYKISKFGGPILDAINKTPDMVVFEYTGGAKPPSWWDSL